MEEKEDTITIRASQSVAKVASEFASKNNIPLRVYTDEALKYWNEKYQYSQEAVIELVELKGGSLKLRRDFFEKAFKDSKKHIRKHFIDLLSKGNLQNIYELSLTDLKEKGENLKKEVADHFLFILRINPKYNKEDKDFDIITSTFDEINGKKGDCFESIFDSTLLEEFRIFIISINEGDKKEEKNG